MAKVKVEVLCVGHASFDLLFEVPRHPGADEKLVARTLTSSGGGPAANAAVMVARLGYRAAFAGYLGRDPQGEQHLAELIQEGVDTRAVARGDRPTPLSVILAKPGGDRALVNYRGEGAALSVASVDLKAFAPRVLLFDGHEPELSAALLDQPVPKVLDAGSLHAGTERLMRNVDHLVASERFAAQWLGREDPQAALESLSSIAPVVVITLGARGLIYQNQGTRGSMKAPQIRAVDTTGAGDAFHGAYAAGLAAGFDWLETLRLSSVAGALCCEAPGARPGLPSRSRVEALLARGFEEA